MFLPLFLYMILVSLLRIFRISTDVNLSVSFPRVIVLCSFISTSIRNVVRKATGLCDFCIANENIRTFVYMWMADQDAASSYNQLFVLFTTFFFWRCPWCNGYRRRIWTRRHEFKSWTWLIAFHIALIPLGKVWIQLFSLQLWVNSMAD